LALQETQLIKPHQPDIVTSRFGVEHAAQADRRRPMTHAERQARQLHPLLNIPQIFQAP
jgi:hypothetical protein